MNIAIVYNNKAWAKEHVEKIAEEKYEKCFDVEVPLKIYCILCFQMH